MLNLPMCRLLCNDMMQTIFPSVWLYFYIFVFLYFHVYSSQLSPLWNCKVEIECGVKN